MKLTMKSGLLLAASAAAFLATQAPGTFVNVPVTGVERSAVSSITSSTSYQRSSSRATWPSGVP